MIFRLGFKSNDHSFGTDRDRKRQLFFTSKAWAKIILPKMCVNNDKSNLRQNSVTGPKDQNNPKKMPKSNIKYQNVLKMPPKSAKLQHYSLSRQNSLKFCKDSTQYRIFLYTNMVCTFVHFSILGTDNGKLRVSLGQVAHSNSIS